MTAGTGEGELRVGGFTTLGVEDMLSVGDCDGSGEEGIDHPLLDGSYVSVGVEARVDDRGFG